MESNYEKYIRLVVVGIVTFSSSYGFAQADYPLRPVTIIVSLPPGGVTDVVGRELANGAAHTFTDHG